MKIDNTYITAAKFLLEIDSIFISIDELKEKLNIGYNHASAILEDLATRGIVDQGEFINEKWVFVIDKEKLGLFLLVNDPIFKTRVDEKSELTSSSNGFLYTLIFILIAAPLFYLFLTFIFGDKKKEIDYCNSEERAYLASTNMVRNTLKSPSLAKFPHYTEVEIYPAGQCSFQIKSYVDAKNGFGAMIRKPYLTVVTYDEKTQSYLQKSLNFE
ncbi:hypothetical protein [Proteus mirabilis]|uniref:hypothetical protein n=1 Tax=Proteus mirabilis TaxID=584 RepID=UPI002576BBAC|nr:hypothetical protein [Proteus mirabilis]EKU0927439.1 hypothetical protein [Proteus mirabilis]MDM3646668.1 hypothetical protein [Proteus mirabilis]